MVKMAVFIILSSLALGKIIDMKVKRNTGKKFLNHIMKWRCELCGNPLRLIDEYNINHRIWKQNKIDDGHAHSEIEWKGRTYIHICAKRGVPDFKPNWDTYNKIFEGVGKWD